MRSLFPPTVVLNFLYGIPTQKYQLGCKSCKNRCKSTTLFCNLCNSRTGVPGHVGFTRVTERSKKPSGSPHSGAARRKQALDHQTRYDNARFLSSTSIICEPFIKLSIVCPAVLDKLDGLSYLALIYFISILLAPTRLLSKYPPPPTTLTIPLPVLSSFRGDPSQNRAVFGVERGCAGRSPLEPVSFES